MALGSLASQESRDLPKWGVERSSHTRAQAQQFLASRSMQPCTRQYHRFDVGDRGRIRLLPTTVTAMAFPLPRDASNTCYLYVMVGKSVLLAPRLKLNLCLAAVFPPFNYCLP